MEKASEGKMRELVVAVAGGIQGMDNRKSLVARAARRAGITYRTCKAIFYGEITDPRHLAIRALRQAAQGKQEANKLATQFQTIAGALNAQDADFYSADIAALIDAARALRGLDRA